MNSRTILEFNGNVFSFDVSIKTEMLHEFKFSYPVSCLNFLHFWLKPNFSEMNPISIDLLSFTYNTQETPCSVSVIHSTPVTVCSRGLWTSHLLVHPCSITFNFDWLFLHGSMLEFLVSSIFWTYHNVRFQYTHRYLRTFLFFFCFLPS